MKRERLCWCITYLQKNVPSLVKSNLKRGEHFSQHSGAAVAVA
jgi:hypothetical protein